MALLSLWTGVLRLDRIGCGVAARRKAAGRNAAWVPAIAVADAIRAVVGQLTRLALRRRVCPFDVLRKSRNGRRRLGGILNAQRLGGILNARRRLGGILNGRRRPGEVLGGEIRYRAFLSCGGLPPGAQRDQPVLRGVKTPLQFRVGQIRPAPGTANHEQHKQRENAEQAGRGHGPAREHKHPPGRIIVPAEGFADQAGGNTRNQ